MKYNFALSKFQDDKVHQEILNYNLLLKKRLNNQNGLSNSSTRCLRGVWSGQLCSYGLYHGLSLYFRSRLIEAEVAAVRKIPILSAVDFLRFHCLTNQHPPDNILLSSYHFRNVFYTL